MLTTKTLTGLAAATLLLAGCGSGSGSGADSDKRTTLTVFAAASLKNTFTEIGRDFEAAHPGVTVRFSFGGSSDLVSQIQAGAPADVFASADTTTMDKLASSVSDRHDFASNTLEIAVPPANPAHVATFADLAKPGVKVVVCAPEVPCGAATAKVETAAGVTIKPVSEEQSVTDVLGKVSTGEADAGLVYKTDVEGAKGTVKGVAFPEASGAVNTYPIAELKTSTAAGQFIDFVLGSRGQHVLAAAGFAKP